MHAPEVAGIAKGKAHKRYELGAGVSVAITNRDGSVVGMLTHAGNPYDGQSLALAPTQVERLTGAAPARCHVDRGYRGHGVSGATAVFVVEDEELAAGEEAMPPADMTFIEVQEAAQFLADEEVIGEDVVNPMDVEVGEIADLLMDQDQRLVGVVLSVGGFLGLGEKWVAVPVDTIEFPSADQPARLWSRSPRSSWRTRPTS